MPAYDQSSRSDTTISVAITRIVEQLRQSLGLTTRDCFETIDALTPPEFPTSADMFVTVSPTTGNFIQDEQFPASLDVDGNDIPGQCTEEFTVDVSAYVRLRLDAADHHDSVVQDSIRGLYPAKRRILAALVGRDLTLDSNTTFLRQPLYAIGCSQPYIDDTQGIASLTLSFGLDFDWELTL